MIKDREEIVEAVKSRNAVTGLTHNFYKYPARFSHEFARQMIASFSQPGDCLLDPFMGGGTAIVEALGLGRFATGVDINELAHFVTRIKTTPLSGNDHELILEWLRRLSGLRTRALSIAEAKVVNLPWHVQRLFENWLVSLSSLPEARQRDFVRCALLKTGQWAIDCRDQIPSYAEMRSALQQNVKGMLDALDSMVDKCKAHGIRKNKITSRRHLLCRSSIGLEDEAGLRDQAKFRLVVTSPPYYGVHVIYHRWQVGGRRETPAPYWITGLNDGNGLSYYTFGSRRTVRGHEQYFGTLQKAFRSIKELLQPRAMVIQLVSFEEASEQLPLYLGAMAAAGFREADVLSSEDGGRIWRSVPHRKWYSGMRKEEPDSAKEVLLLHQPA